MSALTRLVTKKIHNEMTMGVQKDIEFMENVTDNG